MINLDLKNNSYFKFKFLAGLLLVFGVLMFFGGAVKAADPKLPIRDNNYAAKYVSQSISDPIEIEAGKTKTVVFKFKNIGTATWAADSNRYISAYTVEPKYRESEFKGSNWLGKSQTAKVSGTVKPGEIGELELQLTAPEKVGDYVERFYLAAENYSWLEGSYFFIKIKVVEATVPVETVVAEEPEANLPPVLETEEKAEELIYKARPVGLNIKSVTAKGGELVKVISIIQNKGTAAWNKFSFLSNEPVNLASVSDRLTFADESWQSSLVVVEKQESILPGKFVRETFYFRAPSKKGTYTASFKLAADDNVLDDLALNISVTVTEDAPVHYQVPSFNDASASQSQPRLDGEPRIRVGLWKPEAHVVFVSNESDYIIYDGLQPVDILAKGTKATLTYFDGIYSLKKGEQILKSTNYFRLEPENGYKSVFVLENYDRKVSWKGPNNFNKYRGAMEFRLTQDKKDVYVINDLLFEDYVAGIAETSNASPIEYIKALLTAARTYAYYVKEYSSKHDQRNFDVVAHTGDQLYLGYVSEELMPRVVEAVRSTNGYMITYDTDNNPETQSDIVITPYFANSDGRTRAWTEVWGGVNKPWLVSVKTHYDMGRSMYGHGVGMSARDAAYRADEEGLDWQELIKYYYSGVEVERIY